MMLMYLWAFAAMETFEARQMFSNGNEIKIKEKLEAQPDVFTLREWLVKNAKGFRMKEVSIFNEIFLQRNSGLSTPPPNKLVYE